MKCKKLEMLPVECIVRGYITGKRLASYCENGTDLWHQTSGGIKNESENAGADLHTILKKLRSVS